jgi:hypothetical protein
MNIKNKNKYCLVNTKISIFIVLFFLELVINENLKEAFIIGVDEKAKQRLNRLTEANKATPIDIADLLSKQLHQQQFNSSSSSACSNDISPVLNTKTTTNKSKSFSSLSSYSLFSLSNKSIDLESSITNSSITNKMVKHKLAECMETFNESNNDSISIMQSNQQMPIKMITFNPGTGATTTNSSSNTAGITTTSSPVHTTSTNKRPAPLAPLIVSQHNKQHQHEPIVKIKDNQIKSAKKPMINQIPEKLNIESGKILRNFVFILTNF